MTGHVLPPLPYDYAALQPWIDEHTMRIHHDRHHQANVDALNAAEARLAAARQEMTQQRGDIVLIRLLQELIGVYAAEHVLHCLFWENMGPNQGGRPTDELADQIVQDFGSFAAFKSEFSATAISLDVGGWVVLAWQVEREHLTITTGGLQPRTEWIGPALLVLDMCEHAYYLKYQHRRAEYAYNWWNTVKWSCVARRLAALASPELCAARSHPTRCPGQDEQASRCRTDTR